MSNINHSANFHKFKDALRYVLANYENKGKKKGVIVKRGEALRHLAHSLLWVALNGNPAERMAAINTLIDRLDGKAVQAITGPEGEPITIVQRVIVQGAMEAEPGRSGLTLEAEVPRPKDIKKLSH